MREKRHVNAGDLFASVLQESHEGLLRLIGLRMTLLLARPSMTCWPGAVMNDAGMLRLTLRLTLKAASVVAAMHD